MTDLARIHPAVVLAFLASAIVFAIVVRNPAFAGMGLALAAVSYLCVRGMPGWRMVALSIALVPVVAVMNALFNPQGATVLFEYLGGRHFTVESLALGAVTGASLSMAILWFGCFDRLMTADRLMYLFGRFAPALTLTVTMALRLVPRLFRKAADVAFAQRCIGAGASEGAGMHGRVRAQSDVLASLATWALEGSIVTADSMRSRGYGCARRTSYARYAWRPSDALALAVVVALDAMLGACLAIGAEATAYLPVFVAPAATGAFWVGLAAFAALSALPAIVVSYGELRWRLSLSTI